MLIVERGSGDPLVLIPGLQGRWEYARQSVDALSRSHRVLTFPLCDEPSAGVSFDRLKGFDSYAEQVEAVLDDRGITKAALCGISFGGLIALRFAARFPTRTSALVLVSTPGPQWHLKRRHDIYARAPWLFGPLFALESPFRLRQEITVALPDRWTRFAFGRRQLRTLVQAPLSFSRMASRSRSIASYDRLADCAILDCPTLVVHGEPSLDHVVDTSGTSDYARLIRGAAEITLTGTGHLGSMTKAEEFARVVAQFLESVSKGHRHSAA